MVWAIATRNYELGLRNKNKKVSETLRQFLGQAVRQGIHTSTRNVYNPEGEEDEAIHNYGTSEQYSIKGNIAGIGGFVHKISDKRTLETFFGTQNAIRINEVAQSVNRTDAYIRTLDSKPKEREERVARFYADDDRLGLFCDGDPRGEYPAFRVLKVE